MAQTNPDSAVAYLCLTKEAQLQQEWERAAAKLGIRLQRQVPETIEAAASYTRSGSRFVVAAVANDGDLALSSDLPVRSVSGLPLVIMMAKPPREEEVEYLRLQGASHVFVSPMDREEDRSLMTALARAQPWARWEIRRNLLPDLLQIEGGQGRSVMVSVACPHCPPLGAYAWEDQHSDKNCVTGLDDGEGCRGWYGRLHITSGLLINAETSQLSGQDALAKTLALQAGSVSVQEIFIPPQTPNLGGSVQSNLVAAAVRLDHEQAGISPGGKTPGPESRSRGSTRSGAAPSRGNTSKKSGTPPPTPQEKDKDMSLSKLLSSASGLQTIAKSDREGSVEEAAGQGDAEELAAVTSMCNRALAEAGALLAIGDPVTWSINGDKVTLYCLANGDSLYAVRGSASQNPRGTLTKLAKAIGMK